MESARGNNFKPGDVVVCVNDGPVIGGEDASRRGLKKGVSYTVTELEEGKDRVLMLRVGSIDYGWFAHRFVKIEV